MKYRNEIDGLRAIAVSSVIFFHAGFELFKGGFLGVDVFFVGGLVVSGERGAEHQLHHQNNNNNNSPAGGRRRR